MVQHRVIGVCDVFGGNRNRTCATPTPIIGVQRHLGNSGKEKEEEKKKKETKTRKQQGVF